MYLCIYVSVYLCICQCNHSRFVLVGFSLTTSLLPQFTTSQAALEVEAKQMTKTLVDMAEMLDEYFSVRISVADESSDCTKVDTAMLAGMPELLSGHSPQMEALPIFLVRLVREVDWTDEKQCFRCIAWEIAEMYAQLPQLPLDKDDDDEQLLSTDPGTISGRSCSYDDVCIRTAL
jgi:hypothetical protein